MAEQYASQTEPTITIPATRVEPLDARPASPPSNTTAPAPIGSPARPLRIAFFTPNFLPKVGGTEIATDALATQFHRRGHHVHVLAQGRRGHVDTPYPVDRFAKPLLPRICPERVGRHLAALHRRHRFDVFLVNYANPTGYGALLVGKRLGIPTVIISHGGDLYKSSDDRRRPGVWRRTIHTYNHADALIVISPYIRSLILDIAPDPPPMALIPNGVDIEDVNRPATRPADLTGDAPFILCLGNLGPMKGFDTAIDAFDRVRDRLGPMRLLIVGDGPCGPALRKRAAAAHAHHDIVFLGKRTGNDKRWLLQHCAFGLMPSIEEGHALVGGEFIAAGRPLITSTNASFDGTCEDELNGLRVPAQNPDALAHAILRLATQLDRDAMGAASRRLAQSFRWTSVADRYLQFLTDIVAQHETVYAAHPLPA